MKKNMVKESIVVGVIFLLVGASGVLSIRSIAISDADLVNESGFTFEDMDHDKNPLLKAGVFEDDFDTGNTPGTDPTGWSVIEVSDADVSITDSVYVSSPYSVELYNPTDSAINLWHDFTPISNGTVECWMRASSDGCGILTQDEAGQWGIEVFFRNGKIMYLDSSGWNDMDPPFTYISNIWYHFRFEFDCDTDTYDIYIDDDLKKSGAIMKDPSTNFDEVWFLCEYGYVCTGYIDNVMISCPVTECQVTELLGDWNFVSLPFNQSVDKTALVVRYAGTNYTWSDAITYGYINDYVFGWNRITQSYTFANTLEPGYGYWVYAYEPCELWIENLSATPDDYITDLDTNWNIVGVPYNENVNKVDILIDDTDWDTAVSNGWISDFVFGWSRTGQSYTFADTFMPGYAYWMYAYQPCTLKRVI